MRSVILTCVFAILIFLCSDRSYGQCNNDNWTTDASLKTAASDHLAQSRQAVQFGNFRAASIALSWLFNNAPNATTEIYTLGHVVYDTLAELEKKDERRKVYVDSLMIVYDLQDKFCGDANAFRDKVLAFYKFNSSKFPSKSLALFDSLLNKQGSNVSDQTVIAYMETVKKLFRKENKLKDDQILVHYNRAMRIAEFKQRQARRQNISEEPYLRMKDDIDAILFSIVVIDCNFVKKNLGPRFRQHPEDLTLARKILSFMFQNQCIEDPLWLEAGERLYKSNTEKEFTLAKSLGLRYFTLERFAKAESFFEDAASVAPSDRDKGEILLYLGRIKAKVDKPEARKIFQQVIQLDRGNKEPYERIGDLYFNSFNDCDANENPIDNLLVYFIAAEYFQRSGNDQKVAMARDRFPTKAELAAAGYTSGTEKLVGCWIQEPATIRTKD